jgi:hypothetical protein
VPATTPAPAEARGAGDTAAAPEADYFYSISNEGNPVFTQVLRWEADENALDYELVVRQSGEGGTEEVHEKVDEAKAEIQLAAGSYEYKVIYYNLLGKPEQETAWIPLRIIKAEMPVIAQVSPAVIYMDDLDDRITLKGQKLVDGCKVFLLSGQTSYQGTEVLRQGEESLVLTFPDKAYQAGEFDIKVVNPGGLMALSAKALRIRFQRPVDVLVSVGYLPEFYLYDDWVKSTWPDPLYPLGVEASLELFFVKQRWAFVGAELDEQYRHMAGGQSSALLSSDYLLSGLDAVFAYRMTRRAHLLARLGGGLAKSWHSFDYQGAAGPSTTSLDPFVQAGLTAQFFLPSKVFFEPGATWTQVFLKSDAMGSIAPSLRVGYQLF